MSMKPAAADVVPFIDVYFTFALSPQPTVENFELAICAALAATPDRFASLAAEVGDPLAWAPILQMLLLVPPRARGPYWNRAFAQLHGVAQQLLDAQGAAVLRPEDLLLRPGAAQRVVEQLCLA